MKAVELGLNAKRARCNLTFLRPQMSETAALTYQNYPNFFQDSQSFQVGKPLIYSWQSAPKRDISLIANVFFGGQYCLFQQRYLEPQVLSTHTNLGSGNARVCTKTTPGSYIRLVQLLHSLPRLTTIEILEYNLAKWPSKRWMFLKKALF